MVRDDLPTVLRTAARAAAGSGADAPCRRTEGAGTVNRCQQELTIVDVLTRRQTATITGQEIKILSLLLRYS